MCNKTQKPRKNRLKTWLHKNQNSEANWLNMYSFVKKVYLYPKYIKNAFKSVKKKNQAIQEEIRQRLWIGGSLKRKSKWLWKQENMITLSWKANAHKNYFQIHFFTYLINKHRKIRSIKNTGLPWWRSGWESACQCRGHRFEPWSGKIPHATEQLGP